MSDDALRRTRVRRRRAGLLLATGLALAVLGVVAGGALQPGDPPRVFVELSVADVPLAHAPLVPDEPPPVPAGVVVGAPFEVFVSVDVPSVIRVRYGATELVEVAQDVRASLLAEPGDAVLSVEAEDAAGRVGRFETIVRGSWAPRPELEAVAAATVGEALTVRLRWPAPEGDGPELAVVDAAIELEGERLTALPGERAITALVPMPLDAQPGPRALRAWIRDERGAVVERLTTVVALPNPNPVQELNVAASTLAVVTPDGRALEAEALDAAFAAVGPVPRWDEPFVLPLEGRATSAFGLPRRYAPGGPVSFHLGTDIAAPTGTPIVATNDGVVRVAGMYPIKGGLVILDHGFGVTSLYFHQSRILVEVGEVVRRGQVIGEVGSTGLSTGPHLHWEMRVDGVPTAPLAWVDRTWPGAADELAVGGD